MTFAVVTVGKAQTSQAAVTPIPTLLPRNAALEQSAEASASRRSTTGRLVLPPVTSPDGVPASAAGSTIAGADGVRLHVGGPATDYADAHRALAVTRGDDIYFGRNAPRSGRAFGELLFHELAHVDQQRADPRLRDEPLPKRDVDAEREMRRDQIKSTIIDAFNDPSSLKYEDVDLIIAASVHLERDATEGGPLTARSAARGLLAMFDELQRRAKTSERADDGTLLYTSFGTEQPWTPARPHRVEDIEGFDAAHLARWTDLAHTQDPYQVPAPGSLHTRQRVTDGEPGKPGKPTYTLYRLPAGKADPNAPVTFVDDYTLVKTSGMSFKTDEGRAIIYAKIIRRVEREFYRQATHADPHYSVEEERDLDVKALETAHKLSAKYTPPIDKTSDQFEDEFEKRSVGSQFTIEVNPSFYAELAQYDVEVPDSYLYAWMRKKPEGDTSSLWKPILPSATLEERLQFAWRQLQFAKTSGAVNRYKPGSVTDDKLMFLYQASGEDMVFLFPDGRIMMVNERALLLEAFRQGVLQAAGGLLLGVILIGLALAVIAAPVAIEGLAAAGATISEGASTLYLLALQNPVQAMVAAEIAVSTTFTIVDMGWDGFVDSLKTPQGAAMLLYDILLFQTSGGGGRVSPTVPEPEPEVPPPPRIPSRPAPEIDVEPAPTTTAPSRGGPQIETEPEVPTTPRANTPDVTEPEPATAAPRTGPVDPDETMHEGKPSYGKPTDVEIAGEDHELVVTKEDNGKARVRICSKSCDFVVKKLTDARDALEDTPENAPARARMADLIEEGEQIDKEFATNADREARRAWKGRLDQYRQKLSDATDQYPEIGDALTEVLDEGKPLLRPGDTRYTGAIKQRSWRLVPKGAGAHLFERANVKNRPSFAKLDQNGTPRYYPESSPENAGQAHLRLHDATDAADIELGGSTMTEDQLIAAYKRAYSSPSLEGITGDLRTPNSGLVLATHVTPGEAFDLLLEWAGL